MHYTLYRVMCMTKFGRFRRMSHEAAAAHLGHSSQRDQIVRARKPRPYGHIVVYELPENPDYYLYYFCRCVSPRKYNSTHV